MAWTYILECSDGSFYVGSTVNLENRIVEHNRGDGARYTARRRPVRVAWAGEFARIDEAFAFEKQVQNWSRAKRIALIEGRFSDLPELAKKHGITWRMNQEAAAGRACEPDPAGRACSEPKGEQSVETTPHVPGD